MGTGWQCKATVPVTLESTMLASREGHLRGQRALPEALSSGRPTLDAAPGLAQPSSLPAPPARPGLSQEPVESDLRCVHLLHLRQGGRLQQDPGPWALGAAPGIRDGQVDAGSGLDVPGAGVEDTRQRAKPWGSQTRVEWRGQDRMSGGKVQGGGRSGKEAGSLAHPGRPSAGPPRGAASAPA